VIRARPNLLFDYLAGTLTMEQLKERVADSDDPASREGLRLAEFDRLCRRMFSGLKPRPGAAERLEELVSQATLDKNSPGEPPAAANFWPLGASALRFDVIGAQKVPRNKRQKRGKKRPGKDRNRSS
jgi:hypothetical protein